MTTLMLHRPADLGRQTADLLLDHEELSALVGRPVRATRLRHKPALSTLAALTDGEQPTGWVHAVTERHLVKLDKTLRRARRRGLTVQVADTGTGITVAWGCLDSDPRLHKALHDLAAPLPPAAEPTVTRALAAEQLRLLRYNPHRRLVLHRPGPDGGTVLRVTVDRQHRPGELPAALRQARVPVLEPLDSRDYPPGGRISVWPIPRLAICTMALIDALP